MTPKIALYGGNFNPPGLHHQRIAEALAQQFDQVLVVPCGPRPDKQTLNHIEPVYRATMADLAFRGIKKVEVDLFDLEQATFTRAHALEKRFSHLGEIWHVVGSDLLVGGKSGSSRIQKTWEKGEELWKNARFAVITRRGYALDPEDLPPHHCLLSLDIEGSSATIREKLYQQKGGDELLSPEVAAYIQRHGLYQGGLPRRKSLMRFDENIKLLIVADEQNPRALAWAKEFEKYSHPERPDCVLVLGGDGSMLHAIQKYWRLRVPFFGINAGHLGFLLNSPQEVLGGKLLHQELIFWQLPLLYVEMQGVDGQWKSMLSFNDAWVERASGQTAWVQVKVNDRVRIEKLVCDGVLVSTAAGSTAYARAMGAAPLLASTPAWLLVGSNVMQPPNWKSAMLAIDSEVEITTLDPQKRPMLGYVYGVSMGQVRAMRARMSRIAAVDLGFCASHDLAEKIAQIQFPQG